MIRWDLGDLARDTESATPARAQLGSAPVATGGSRSRSRWLLSATVLLFAGVLGWLFTYSGKTPKERISPPGSVTVVQSEKRASARQEVVTGEMAVVANAPPSTNISVALPAPQQASADARSGEAITAQDIEESEIKAYHDQMILGY